VFHKSEEEGREEVIFDREKRGTLAVTLPVRRAGPRFLFGQSESPQCSCLSLISDLRYASPLLTHEKNAALPHSWEATPKPPAKAQRRGRPGASLRQGGRGTGGAPAVYVSTSFSCYVSTLTDYPTRILSQRVSLPLPDDLSPPPPLWPPRPCSPTVVPPLSARPPAFLLFGLHALVPLCFDGMERNF